MKEKFEREGVDAKNRDIIDKKKKEEKKKAGNKGNIPRDVIRPFSRKWKEQTLLLVADKWRPLARCWLV